MADPTLAQLLAFALALGVAFVVPGPAMLVALHSTLRGGLAAGLATGAGLALMAAGWTAAAFAGLGVLFALAPWLYGTLKVAGALYLIWIAVRTWREAGRAAEAAGLPPARARLGRAFAGGILVNLANPKSVLFAGAVIVVIFPAGLGASGAALTVGLHFALELAGYAAVALALSRPSVRAGYLRIRPWTDRAAAAVLGALGLRLLLPR